VYFLQSKKDIEWISLRKIKIFIIIKKIKQKQIQTAALKNHRPPAVPGGCLAAPGCCLAAPGGCLAAPGGCLAAPGGLLAAP